MTATSIRLTNPLEVAQASRICAESYIIGHAIQEAQDDAELLEAQISEEKKKLKFMEERLDYKRALGMKLQRRGLELDKEMMSMMKSVLKEHGIEESEENYEFELSPNGAVTSIAKVEKT